MAATSSTFFKILKTLFVGIICAALVAAGLAVAAHMMRTAPKPDRQAPTQLAPLVQTTHVHAISAPVVISAVGTVIPAVEVTLSARVTGEVTAVHPQFHPGGLVRKGAVLVQLDQQDYELAIPLKQSQLETARYELMAEQGQQEIAQIEWDMMDQAANASPLELELALRRPQLRQKEANVRATEAALELAQVELARTTISAPCNAMLLSREVNAGDLATPQKALATLVGTDVFWVQVSVPTDQLKWLHIPRSAEDPASAVRIACPRGPQREGRILGLLGALEPQGRMAQLRVEVDDPLALSGSQGDEALLLGEFVRVEFTGKTVDNVFRISRDTVHDGRYVWVVDAADQLDFKEVEQVWSDEKISLVRGLADGDLVIVSDLAGPIAGMKVQIQSVEEEARRDMSSAPGASSEGVKDNE